MIVLLSWVAAIGCLTSYAVLARTGRITQYHVVNLLASLPLVVTAVLAAVWANGLVSLFYGLVAAWSLVSRRSSSK